MKQAISNVLVHAVPDPLETSPEQLHHPGSLSFRSMKPSPSSPLSLSPRSHHPKEPLPRHLFPLDLWAAADPEDPKPSTDSDPSRAVLSLGIWTANHPVPKEDLQAEPEGFPRTGGGFGGLGSTDAAASATGLAH